MRMWLNCILRGLTRGQASERAPVLFLLDEAAHLGKLQIIEDAVTLMRGYGIRLWFFFQSIDQLNKCFGDHAPTILENLDTQQHFGVSSFDAAEELSKWMGDTTIAVSSGSETDGRSVPTGPSAQGPTPGSRSSSTTVSYSMTGRRLAFASELITAGDDFQFIFTRNLPPIPATLLRYYEVPEFRWGGTGRQDGLGLRGLAAAFVVMLLSLMAPPFFATISPMLRNGFEHPTAMQALDGQPGVYEPEYASGAYRPSPYRSSSYRSRRYGGMGGMSRYSR
jgi:type IV secretion system protein VirD4